MTLTEECIMSLGNSAKILSSTEKKSIENEFFNNIKLTLWGEFDFKKIEIEEIIENIKICDVDKYLKDIKYYIIWDDYTRPSILCNLKKIIENIDDVTAVSTNTWLMSEDKKKFIEIYHGERISIVKM